MILPHIKNVKAGINKWDPVISSVFEVAFTLPEAISGDFSGDIPVLTEQVTQVDGLNTLQKTVTAQQQKFLGIDVSFLSPVLDNSYADIQIQFNLNLRDAKDNYVLKIFKAWAALGYNLADGTRTLKKDYTADTLRVAEANRNGDIWRSVTFNHVMITNIEGLQTLNYTTMEAAQITVTFRSDFWEEELG